MSGWESSKEKRRLQRINPLCAQCEREGHIGLGVILDHVIPLAEGGAEAPGNRQLLCVPHHDLKSEAERLRGTVSRGTKRS